MVPLKFLSGRLFGHESRLSFPFCSWVFGSVNFFSYFFISVSLFVCLFGFRWKKFEKLTLKKGSLQQEEVSSELAGTHSNLEAWDDSKIFWLDLETGGNPMK
jgi:hypothetical protein